MNKKFDSKAEAKAYPFLQSLGFVHITETFDCTFSDSEGKEFKAKPDFYHPALDLYLEYKTHPLNTKRSYRTAKNACEKMNQKYVKNTTYFKLENAWNHSIAKQAIVQKRLSTDKFIVCFDKAIDSKDMDNYCKKGLYVCTLNSIESYLGYILMKLAGFKVSFSLRNNEYEPAYTLH